MIIECTGILCIIHPVLLDGVLDKAVLLAVPIIFDFVSVMISFVF